MSNKFDKILDEYRESDVTTSLVTSLNGLTGAVVLAAGTNVTLTTVGNTVTISSSLVWGSITGTLTNQTDLVTALNLKVNTTSFTLAGISANSLNTTNSRYTMTSTIPVEFKSSDGNSLLYLHETSEQIGIGTSGTLYARAQIKASDTGTGVIIYQQGSTLADQGSLYGSPNLLTLNAKDTSPYQLAYVNEGIGSIANYIVGSNSLEFDHINLSSVLTAHNVLIATGGMSFYSATSDEFGIYPYNDTTMGIGIITSYTNPLLNTPGIQITATQIVRIGSGTSSFTDVGGIGGMTAYQAGGNTYYVPYVGQNTSSGTTASTDFILGNNLATDTTNYSDFGISSSNNADPLYTGLAAGGAYWFNASGEVAIATATLGKVVKILAGGTLTANIVSNFNQGALQNWVQGTTGIGTVSNSAGGTTVTGVNTLFISTFTLGDTVTIGGQTVAISAIASNTSMTTAAITNANSGVAYTLTGGTVGQWNGNGIFQIGSTTADNASYSIPHGFYFQKILLPASSTQSVGEIAGLAKSATNTSGQYITTISSINNNLGSAVNYTNTLGLIAIQGVIRQGGGQGTVTGAAAFSTLQSTQSGGGTITNQYGYYATDFTQGTNIYGFYSNISSGTNKFGFYSNGTALNYFNGGVGIGIVPSTAGKLEVTDSNTTNTNGINLLKTQSNSTSYNSGITSTFTSNQTSASFTGTLAGQTSQIFIGGSNTQNWTGNGSGESVSGAVGLFARVEARTSWSGTITWASPLLASAQLAAGGTFTNLAGLKVVDAVNSGTITNQYGIYINNLTAGGTNYGIYQAGSGQNNFFGGKFTTYNNITTVSNGVPSELATIDTTGLTANVGAATLYAVPASGEGLYRISAYVVETTAGSLSSTLPNVQIVYTDKDSNTSITIDATPVLGVAGIGQTGALTANTVGTASSGVIAIYVKASTTIQYQTVNYASNLAGMTYALHLKLEDL